MRAKFLSIFVRGLKLHDDSSGMRWSQIAPLFVYHYNDLQAVVIFED